MYSPTSRIEINIHLDGDGYTKLDPRVWDEDIEYLDRRIGTTRSLHSRVCTETASRYFEGAKTLVQLCSLIHYTDFWKDGITGIQLTVDAMHEYPVANMWVIGQAAGFKCEFAQRITKESPELSEFFALSFINNGGTINIPASEECVNFYTNPNKVLAYQENFPPPSKMIQMINSAYAHLFEY